MKPTLPPTPPTRVDANDSPPPVEKEPFILKMAREMQQDLPACGALELAGRDFLD